MSLDMRRRFDDVENSLADKIRIAVNEIITDVRAELDAKLAALEARVMALEDRPAAPAQDDRSLNFVIFDMAESENENIEEKVNSLVSTQLSLPEVKVESAQRKQKPEGRDAGIILVECSDIIDKRKIMEAKSKLNTFKHFKHIRIFHDKPRWQRQHEANVRLLVKSLGTNKLFIRGSRVCERGNQREAWENPNRPQADGEGQGRNGDCGAGRGAPRGNRRGAGRGRNGGRGMRQ